MFLHSDYGFKYATCLCMTHHSLTQTYPDLNVNGLTDLNGYEWVQYLNNTSTDLKARN